MLLGYIYLCLVLFIITCVAIIIIKNLKVSPIKIKYYFTIVLGLLIVKNIVLFIVYLIEKQAIAYSLRNLILLNFISIPLIAIGSLYIFMRNQSLKFDFNYIYMVILIIGYIVFSIFYSKSIRISNSLGFIMIVDNPMIPYLIYLIILATICVVTIWFIDKPNSNKLGMEMLLAVMAVSIIEFILLIANKHILPYPMISEVLILGIGYKAVSTFKKV